MLYLLGWAIVAADGALVRTVQEDGSSVALEEEDAGFHFAGGAGMAPFAGGVGFRHGPVAPVVHHHPVGPPVMAPAVAAHGGFAHAPPAMGGYPGFAHAPAPLVMGGFQQFQPMLYDPRFGPQVPAMHAGHQPMQGVEVMNNVLWPGQPRQAFVGQATPEFQPRMYMEQRHQLIPNRPIMLVPVESGTGDTVVHVQVMAPRPTASAPPAVATLPAAWTFLDQSTAKVVGEGSFGVVSVYDLQDGCGAQDHKDQVTVKRIKETDHQALVQAKKEAELQKVLSAGHHPNICSLMDHAYVSSGAAKGYYTLMEAVGGGELMDHIKEHVDGKANAAEDGKEAWFWRMAGGIMDGVAFLHEQGAIHRDIKPENILVTHKDCFTNPECVVKVIDFGLSCMRVRGESRGAVSPSPCAKGAMGTPEFMSPEALLDMDAAMGRVDAYAIGVTLWKLWHGSETHPIPNMRQVMQMGGMPGLQQLLQRWRANGHAGRQPAQTRQMYGPRGIYYEQSAPGTPSSGGGNSPYLQGIRFQHGTPKAVQTLITGLLLPVGNERWTVGPRHEGVPDAQSFVASQNQERGTTVGQDAYLGPVGCVDHCVDVKDQCRCSKANHWCEASSAV